MYKLRINKDKDGSYFISDHNNERINIFGEIIIDPKVRSYFKQNLDHVSEVLIGSEFRVANTSGSLIFLFKLKDENVVFITLVDNTHDENKIFETDVSKNALVDLIDKAEELFLIQPNELVLTAPKDNSNIFELKIA